MPTIDLAAAFPVLADVAYLNAGTCGPLPSATADAIANEAHEAARVGRGLPYYGRLAGFKDESRAAWGRLLHAPAHEIALTTGASDGIARALGLIDWQHGDEVVTSDEEHPGVLGPLGALVRRHGVKVRIAPWDHVADAVTPNTRLVAVSHVSWLRGRVADLSAIGTAGAPVVVDAAQSSGAIPVDLAEQRRHGVVAYASAGQKWTCGPVGTGSLWVDENWAPDRGAGVWPVHDNLADPHGGLEAQPWPDARRLDSPSLTCELLAGSIASFGVLEGAGWASVHERAVSRASAFATELRERGHAVAQRGPSTLVAWRSDDPQGTVDAATAQGVVIRGFEGEPWVRASIGAWTEDAHLERLLAAIDED
jgi:L-cysteine/cystine lyase